MSGVYQPRLEPRRFGFMPANGDARCPRGIAGRRQHDLEVLKVILWITSKKLAYRVRHPNGHAYRTGAQDRNSARQCDDQAELISSTVLSLSYTKPCHDGHDFKQTYDSSTEKIARQRHVCSVHSPRDVKNEWEATGACCGGAGSGCHKSGVSADQQLLGGEHGDDDAGI